jgi:hypothetical protein
MQKGEPEMGDDKVEGTDECKLQEEDLEGALIPAFGLWMFPLKENNKSLERHYQQHDVQVASPQFRRLLNWVTVSARHLICIEREEASDVLAAGLPLLCWHLH